MSDRLASRIETLSTGAFKSSLKQTRLKSDKEVTLEEMVRVYDSEISRQISEATKEIRAKESAIKRDTPMTTVELAELKQKIITGLNKDGLTPETARHISALARDYVLRGEEDVESVIVQVRKDLDNQVDEYDIAAAFGGLIKGQAPESQTFRRRLQSLSVNRQLYLK